MTNDIKIIDAHHHFWDLNTNYYPFLSDEVNAQILKKLNDI